MGDDELTVGERDNPVFTAFVVYVYHIQTYQKIKVDKNKKQMRRYKKGYDFVCRGGLIESLFGGFILGQLFNAVCYM